MEIVAAYTKQIAQLLTIHGVGVGVDVNMDVDAFCAKLPSCPGRGEGNAIYMCHTETCRRSGYTFWPSNPRQGVFFRA